MTKNDCYENSLKHSAVYETVTPNIFKWLIFNRDVVVFVSY